MKASDARPSGFPWTSLYSGAATYYDVLPESRETKARIYAEYRPQGVGTSFLGLLDTGGHYCILSPEAREAAAARMTDFLGHERLRTAYGPIEGDLCILPIQLLADDGDHLGLEVVAFVAPDWHGPSFLGYTGVLDRLRFGIDPHLNRFFFGPLS